ncbi:hypothetical protein ABPG75_011933 [Micractinium tetrahymenae]
MPTTRCCTSKQTSVAALLVAALAANVLLGPQPAMADWRLCDEGVMTVDGGSANPVPAHAGDEIVFRINGTLDQEVTAGLLEVWVDYLGFHVYSQKGDLCQAVPCPLSKGAQRLTLRQRLPAVTPPGPYLGVFQAREEGGPLLFCVNINFRVALAAAEQGST